MNMINTSWLVLTSEQRILEILELGFNINIAMLKF